MKRLEDRLKDHFDHFQPEVDPAVWQQLSQQISGSQAAPSAKGSIASGSTGWIVGGLAAVLTAGLVYYKVFVADRGSLSPSPAPTTEQVIQNQTNTDKAIPGPNPESLPNKKTSAEQSPAAEPLGDPTPVQEPKVTANGPNQTQDKPAGQTALTGQTGPDKGGAKAVPPTPVATYPTHSTPVQSASTATPSPSLTQDGKGDQTAQPVLILSTSRGFAPLTVTVMTNIEGQIADYDFGDGTTTYGKISATHRYEASGVFEVACTISGKVLRSTVTVAGRIPTAFSPNGDGINDEFTIDNPERTLLDLRIFSRSGQLVFSGKGTDVSWDGRLPSGDLAPEGTYLVHILAPSFEGSTHQQKGTIQLFR